MGESMSQEELDAMLKSMAEENNAVSESSGGESDAVAPPPDTGEAQGHAAAEPAGKAKKPLVQRVEFTQLKPRAKPVTQQANRNLFNNIPLVLSGELGTAEITVRELLALEEGSVVRLDKIAGESATVLVNEQFLGQAETVVVNDRFGLRITAIGKQTMEEKKEEQVKDNSSTDKPPAQEQKESQAEELGE